MRTKTNATPSSEFHGIDTSRRLTERFSGSLKQSWLHPYIRLRKFVHDYSLPVIMTIIFLLVAAAASLLRVSQRSSLADLLAGVTSGGQEYGTLLSRDKTTALKKNSDSTQPAANTPAATNNSSAAPTTTKPPPSATAPAVFSASIAYFRQDSMTLECTTPKPKPQTCSKKYVFAAGIRSKNGPGTVSYGWRSNFQAAVETRNILVSGGEIVTPLQKVITLACTSPLSLNLQIALLSPTASQSTLITNHNCDGI